MNKIVVVGPSGAGKSVLSKKLGSILNCPVYHLDNIFWNNDKTHIENSEFDNKLADILTKDRWIIDGNYARTYKARMDACDTIIFLNYSLETCLNGVESRIGTKRDDLPWIESEFDPSFKEWIINWFKTELDNSLNFVSKYKNIKDVYIFNNRKDTEEFVKQVKFK